MSRLPLEVGGDRMGYSHSVGVISLDVNLNGEKVNRQANEIASRASDVMQNVFTSKAEKSVNRVSVAAKKAGAVIAAAFSVKVLTDFGKECVKLGSDLQEVQNVVDTVFPHMSSSVDKWAKSAAGSYGLSETMAKRFTGTFGAMSKAFGFTEKEAYNMSTTLAGLAGDVASFYNISQDEAYTKLKSVFSGETETLKDLGIVMTQNALDAYAMANGYGKTTAAMTEQEKVSLRLAFVTEQLSSANGDFAKTANSWANQVRVLSLNFDSLKANLGQGLINVLTPAIKVLNTVIAKLSVLAGKFKALTEFLTGKKSSEQSQITDTAAGAADAEENLNAASGAADNLAKSTKKAAKASRDLMGFDKINKLSDKSSSSGTNGTSSASPSTSTSGIDDYATSWDKTMSKMDASSEKFAKKLQSTLRPAQNALNRLYKQGFKKLENFSAGTLKDFYKNFLKPLGSYALGTGFPKLVDYTNKFLKEVKWSKLQKSLSDFYGVLYKLGRLGFTAIETFYKDVLLKLAKWALNSALPRLLDIFTDLSNRVDWKTLNSAVSKFIKAIGNVAKGIGQGLINFVTGFYKATRNIAASAINAIAKAIGKISDVISKMPQSGYDAIIGGLVGMFAAFKAFEKGTAAVEAIKKLKIAASGLITLFGGSKVKLAITAVGALIGAFAALSGNNTVEVKAEGIEELQTAMSQAKDSISATQKAIDDFYDNQNDIEVEYGAVEDLADKYYELSQQTNKSAEQKKRLKTYAKQLIDKIPELKDKIDGETGAYEGTYDQLKKTIAKTKEYYLLQAAEKDMASVGEKLYKSKKKIQDAQAKLNDVTKKYNTIRKTLERDDKQQNVNLQMSASEYDKLVDEMKQYESKIKSTKKELAEYRGEYTKQSNAYKSITKQIGDMQEEYDDLSESAGDSKDEIKKANEEMNKTPDSKTVKLEADAGECMSAIEEAKKAENKDINLKAKKDKNFDKTVTGAKKGLSAKITLTPATPISSLAKKWQQDFEKNFKPKWEFKINGKDGTVTQTINSAYWVPVKKAKGGVFAGGGWKKVQRYAEGGLPSAGQMFIARENGPEMVGKIGSNTAVVNNSQIVASVASGVYSAVARALSTIIAKIQTPALSQKVAANSTPPLAMVGDRSSVVGTLSNTAKQVVDAQSTGDISKVIELLKEILEVIKKGNLDIYMDGEKVTKRIVRIINTHTKANGACEIKM